MKSKVDKMKSKVDKTKSTICKLDITLLLRFLLQRNCFPPSPILFQLLQIFFFKFSIIPPVIERKCGQTWLGLELARHR